MTINSIIWQNVECDVPSANKSWDWNNCLVHFRDTDMISITRMSGGFTTEDSLVLSSCVITEMSPWGFKATAKALIGKSKKFHPATIVGKF